MTVIQQSSKKNVKFYDIFWWAMAVVKSAIFVEKLKNNRLRNCVKILYKTY
jgi:hypothetical protein